MNDAIKKVDFFGNYIHLSFLFDRQGDLKIKTKSILHLKLIFPLNFKDFLSSKIWRLS